MAVKCGDAVSVIQDHGSTIAIDSVREYDFAIGWRYDRLTVGT